MTPSYQLRPMTFEDLTLVLEWRNHPAIRSTTANEKPISWMEHQRWFLAREGSKSILTQDGQSVGVICFDKFGFWSFYLNPALVGKKTGMGLVLLALALHEAKTTGRTEIKARVRKDNKKSIKIHDELGFEVVKTTSDLMELRKKLA